MPTSATEGQNINTFKMLKLLSTGAFAERRAAFGAGGARILLDKVLCTGAESRLVDCQHAGYGIHNCFATEVAGVSCPGEFTFWKNSLLGE